MVGLGTLINVACIAAGGLVGLLCRGAITQRLQQALLRSCGVAVMFVGIAGTLEKMLTASLAADGTIALDHDDGGVPGRGHRLGGGP